MLPGEFILAPCERQREGDTLEAGDHRRLQSGELGASLWDEDEGAGHNKLVSSFHK